MSPDATVSILETVQVEGKMEEFKRSIIEFLEFRKFQILRENGKVSATVAKEKAELEYTEFNKGQKIVSDFDRAIKHLKNKEGGQDAN